MADPTSDFIRDYQTLAQQSWNTWTKQVQQPPQPSFNPFAPPPASPVAGGEVLERTLAGLKGYFDWMQGAAAGGAAPMGDWRQQLQQMFGNAGQPAFSQAFAGIDTAGAEGFAKQWQSWMQNAQNQGMPGMPGMSNAFESMPAFGQHREQQQQQQAMAEAVMESMQASARYQALIQKASAQGMQRLQEKLAQHAEPGRQIDSMKGLYDLWVDASEEGYAEIALSDEFRDAYGDMVNTQMRVRQMQQQQTEQLCQQMGMPTRSEVSSLGERLQALRREFRASQSSSVPEEHEDELVAVKRELSALKRKLANAAAAAPAATKAAPAKRASTKKKAATKKVASKKVAAKKAPAKKAAAKKAVAKTASTKNSPARKTAKKAASSKSKSTTASTSRTSPRKRK